MVDEMHSIWFLLVFVPGDAWWTQNWHVKAGQLKRERRLTFQSEREVQWWMNEEPIELQWWMNDFEFI